MGPIERQLRARLNYGTGLSFNEAYKIGGPIARGVLNRLVRDGEAVQRETGYYTLATYTPSAEALARDEEARLARVAIRKREQEEAEARRIEREEARERQRLEEVERLERERQQRVLWAGLATYSPAEQKLVLAERAAAMRDSRGRA